MPVAAVLKDKRFVDLPGPNPARFDANTVVCVRVETIDDGSFVFVQTNQGFSFGLNPNPNQTINDFYNEVLAAIWPDKT